MPASTRAGVSIVTGVVTPSFTRLQKVTFVSVIVEYIFYELASLFDVQG